VEILSSSDQDLKRAQERPSRSAACMPHAGVTIGPLSERQPQLGQKMAAELPSSCRCDRPPPQKTEELVAGERSSQPTAKFISPHREIPQTTPGRHDSGDMVSAQIIVG